MAYKIIQLKDKNNNNLMPKNTVKSVYLNDGVTTIEQALGLTSSKSTMALGANNILNGTNILSVGGTGVHPTSSVTYSSKEMLEPEGTVSGNKIIFPSGTVVDKIVMKYNGLQEVEGDIYTYFSSWMYFWKTSGSMTTLTAEPKNYYLDKSTNTIIIPLSTAITLEEEYYTFNTTLPCGTLTTADENSYININQVAGGENILTVGKNNQISNLSFSEGIIGGNGNKFEGYSNSSIIFGMNNTVKSSFYQSILSGLGNTLNSSTSYSFISGTNHNLKGIYSSLIGGTNITATSGLNDSLVLGNSLEINNVNQSIVAGEGGYSKGNIYNSLVIGSHGLEANVNNSLLLGFNYNEYNANLTGIKCGLNASYVLGENNLVTSTESDLSGIFIFGTGNQISGASSKNITLGDNNKINSGVYNFAFGVGNQIVAQKGYCEVHGTNNLAVAKLGTIFGQNNQSVGENQFVIGKSNAPNPNFMFIAGNGDSENNTKSNAYTLDWEGNGVYQGSVTASSITLSDNVTANSIILSDTADSSKKFKITINNGAIVVSEV